MFNDSQSGENSIKDTPELRERTGVFRDRAHAGEVLAGLLAGRVTADTVVMAVPAGGVPVAAPLCQVLDLELGLVVVSKVTLPWNTEVGYGAVAFDGTVRVNTTLARSLGLSDHEVREGIARTTDKVARRQRELSGGAGAPALDGRTVVIVDDGLASGLTMEVAVEAVSRAGAGAVHVAVPTAHTSTAHRIAASGTPVTCANLRGGLSFAVASAYRRWADVTEREVREVLAAARGPAQPPAGEHDHDTEGGPS